MVTVAGWGVDPNYIVVWTGSHLSMFDLLCVLDSTVHHPIGQLNRKRQLSQFPQTYIQPWLPPKDLSTGHWKSHCAPSEMRLESGHPHLAHLLHLFHFLLLLPLLHGFDKLLRQDSSVKTTLSVMLRTQTRNNIIKRWSRRFWSKIDL